MYSKQRSGKDKKNIRNGNCSLISDNDRDIGDSAKNDHYFYSKYLSVIFLGLGLNMTIGKNRPEIEIGLEDDNS